MLTERGDLKTANSVSCKMYMNVDRSCMLLPIKKLTCISSDFMHLCPSQFVYFPLLTELV